MNYLRKASAKLLAVILSFGLASAASASIINYAASLGPEEVGATGSGSAFLSFDTVTHHLSFNVSFSGLSGTTSVAHVHCCTATPFSGTVGVAVTPGTLPGFPAGLLAGTYEAIVDLDMTASFTAGFLTASGGTTDGAIAALLAGLDSGRAYFNIHTNRFPGGEIRGFPTAVPEPGTLALLGLGLAGLAASRRRKK